MRTRRLAIGATIVCVIIGLFRGSVQAWLRHSNASEALGLEIGGVLLSVFWLPVVLIVDRAWRMQGSRRAFVGVCALAGAVIVAGEPALAGVIRDAQRLDPGPWPLRVLFRLDTNLLMYGAVLAAVWAIDRRRAHTESELAASEVERALADAELHVLTLQLHPHFLFNTLNLISQLAYERVSDAQRTLANLRALLVQSLAHADRREVSLRDELGFLNAYLEIQQGRFRERLSVVVDVDASVLDVAIPHLLLQPLVENSIVHAVSPRATAGHITVAVSRRRSRLVIEISDDGPGVTLPVHEGMGLGNTRLRLEHLFATDYSLTIERRDAGGTIVTVDIPYRTMLEVQAWPDRATAGIDAAGELEDPVPPPRRRLPGGVVVQTLVWWSMIAMLWTELESIQGSYDGYVFRWSSAAASNAANVGLWMLLTPLVVWIARRLDLSRSPRLSTLAAHFGIGAAVAFVHCAGWLVVVRFVVHSQFRKLLNQSFDWLLWDFVAYVCMVALATALTAAARQRDTRTAIARNRARLSHARIVGLRLRLQPGILLGGLDAIGRALDVDPARAEMAIARMGDLLRGLLRSAEDEEISLLEELSLLRAYHDVLGSAGPLGDKSFHIASSVQRAGVLAVPALATVSLCAVIDGTVDNVDVSVEGNAVVARLRSSDGVVDQERFADLDRRLRSVCGQGYRLNVRGDARGLILELVLPIGTAADAHELRSGGLLTA